MMKLDNILVAIMWLAVVAFMVYVIVVSTMVLVDFL